jgi:large subunit ribosomal protein L15
MKLNELKSVTKYKKSKRAGRGIAGFGGKTAGRGTKGQKARTGYKIPRRFEGGQVSLIQRLPKKRGIRKFRISPEAVRINFILKHFKTGDKISPKTLYAKGLVSSSKSKIKIINSSDSKNLENLLKGYKFSGCIFSGSVKKFVVSKIESKPSEKVDEHNR